MQGDYDYDYDRWTPLITITGLTFFTIAGGAVSIMYCMPNDKDENIKQEDIIAIELYNRNTPGLCALDLDKIIKDGGSIHVITQPDATNNRAIALEEPPDEALPYEE